MEQQEDAPSSDQGRGYVGGRNLPLAIAVGVFLAIIFLASIFWHPLAFTGVIAALIILAYLEVWRVLGEVGVRIDPLVLIVATLVRSIPSMGHVIMLMGVIFYIYGVTGYHIFHEHDPDNWGTLGSALLTLFQIVTLEGWVDVMETAMEAHRWAWIYFVTFVLIGTFVVLNLFIAVVINNLEASKMAELKELSAPTTRDEILAELRRTRDALIELERKLQTLPIGAPAAAAGAGTG